MAFRGLTLGLMIGFEHAEEGARESEVCDNVYVFPPERHVGREMKRPKVKADHAARREFSLTEPARFDQKAYGQRSSPPIIVTGGVSS
jgi:hypothetical protein